MKLNLISIAVMISMAACQPLEVPAPGQKAGRQSPGDDAGMWLNDECSRAGGLFSRLRMHCSCPNPGTVFSVHPETGEGRCTGLKVATNEGPAKWTLDGSSGSISIGTPHRHTPIAPGFIVPGYDAITSSVLLPESALFFAHGIEPSAGIQVVGYEKLGEIAGISSLFNYAWNPYPLGREPKGLTSWQQSVYEKLAHAKSLIWGSNPEALRPLGVLMNLESGNCLESCVATWNARKELQRLDPASSYEKVDLGIVVETEVIGGARAHQRLAYYVDGDRSRLAGMITLNLNNTVGLVAIGKDATTNPKANPSLKEFSFFNADGQAVDFKGERR